MSEPLQPFTPDQAYCVYCHAPAAGQCAVCGAYCCGDCVELVMGLTRYRATCIACLEQGWRPGGVMALVRVAAPVVALLAFALALLALGVV